MHVVAGCNDKLDSLVVGLVGLDAINDQVVLQLLPVEAEEILVGIVSILQKLFPVLRPDGWEQVPVILRAETIRQEMFHRRAILVFDEAHNHLHVARIRFQLMVEVALHPESEEHILVN